MKTFKKHHQEHLDDTKGAWRPTLVATVFGSDGHPVAWKEIVVVSCHECGLQYGVGGDEAQIQENGQTDRPVTCHHCKTTDHHHYDLHADAVGREHFAKLKKQAEDDVKEARLRVLKQLIAEQIRKEADDRAMEAAKQILPDGANNPQELFNNAKKRYQ